MSFLLVLAAAVTLVVGLLQSGLTLIYLSIGCSVVAGLVLAVAVLRGRPEPKAAPYVAPPRPVSPAPAVPSYTRSFESYEPEPEPADEPWRVEPPPTPARRFGRPAAAEEPEEEVASPVAGYARRAAGRGASVTTADIASTMPAATAKGAFPISDYESLRAPELLRRVDELDSVAALEEVRAAEAAGKNRVSIIARIDSRLETLREPSWDIDEAAWEGAEPAAAEPGPDAGDDLPIPDYDGLRVGQILPLLRDLDPGALAEVRAYEEAGKGRSTILDRIDFLAGGGTRPAAAGPAAPAAAAAAAEPAAPAAGGGKSAIAAAVAAAKAKQAKKG